MTGLACSTFKKNEITPKIECVYGGHVLNTMLYQTVNHEYAGMLASTSCPFGESSSKRRYDLSVRF